MKRELFKQRAQKKLILICRVVKKVSEAKN